MNKQIRVGRLTEHHLGRDGVTDVSSSVKMWKCVSLSYLKKKTPHQNLNICLPLNVADFLHFQEPNHVFHSKKTPFPLRSWRKGWDRPLCVFLTPHRCLHKYSHSYPHNSPGRQVMLAALSEKSEAHRGKISNPENERLIWDLSQIHALATIPGAPRLKWTLFSDFFLFFVFGFSSLMRLIRISILCLALLLGNKEQPSASGWLFRSQFLNCP